MILDEIEQNERILIKGNPGSGKSTLMQWVAYTYAKRILDSSEKNLPIPIYLELNSYKDKLIGLICTSFGENRIIEEENVIIDWIKKGGFVFLLDGFDELGNKSNEFLKDIKELLAFSENNRFVITSREVGNLEGLRNINFKVKRIKPLTESQIQYILENYLGKEKGNLLLDKIKEYELLDEASTPLMLWFITLDFVTLKKDDSIKKYINKGFLFRNVLENNFLKRWDKKIISEFSDVQEYFDEKINCLSKLAFHMTEENLVKIEEKKIIEIFYSIFKNGRVDYKNFTYTILNQLYTHNIIELSGYEVSFWHKSFRDYFAALELIKIYSEDSDNFNNRFISEKWEESLIFFSGLMDNPSKFINRLIKPFWRYFLGNRSRGNNSFQLLLAAKCIGGSHMVNIQTQKKITELLIRIIQTSKSDKNQNGIRFFFFSITFEPDKYYQALAYIKSEKAKEFLIGTLENHDCNLDSGYCGTCQNVIEALRNIGHTQKVQNSLLNAVLYIKDNVARKYAFDILRDSMSKEIAMKLVHIVLNKQEKSRIRIEAIHLLIGDLCDYNVQKNRTTTAKLKYPELVISPLIQVALEDECDDVSSRAASALGLYDGEDKEELITNPVIYALHNNVNPNIRYKAAYVLFYFFGEKTTKALIKALYDTNPKVVARVAYKLRGHTSSPKGRIEISRKLSEFFNSTDIDIKINSIISYSVVCQDPSKEEVSQLINLLKDENISVRSCAAEALGRLKIKEAIGLLISLVYEEKYAAPWASYICAISQIEPNFSGIIEKNKWELPYINMLLSDDTKTEERIHALEILRKIGTKTSLPILKEFRKKNTTFYDRGGELFYAINDIEERILHK